MMHSRTGAFFVFDLSPFVVKIDNDRIPLTHFLTKICAIIGGVVSVRCLGSAILFLCCSYCSQCFICTLLRSPASSIRSCTTRCT